ncbi:DUF6545 domain-containing protein [Nocardia sp. NPDC051570]|uniref:DUF6545 domain-containing protein n=1 Tax=Nocardia sp. NPDC051570 TaxID=3364324 RepID=UPI00379D297F
MAATGASEPGRSDIRTTGTESGNSPRRATSRPGPGDSRTAWHSYFRTSELRYLLGRRVIEIRDSWRALRPYLPDNRGTAEDDITQLAAAAASSLYEALEAKSAGETPDEESGASRLERLEATDLDEDIDWLVRVGHAYSAIRRTARSTSVQDLTALGQRAG